MTQDEINVFVSSAEMFVYNSPSWCAEVELPLALDIIDQLQKEREVARTFVAAQEKLNRERPDFSDETFEAMQVAYGELLALFI